ncbi:hypothetical protein P8C59_007123 [Phyllachora maydis]|uniref:Reverse transcriptase Ty1/copia-type domain-containing protein n=1 Tax=Phyllachora maydis TaxID=1825666 RepID=A0AAD9I7W7_9PEZI|nr:hypothetical protein P8C59_007123 [Phyllachora maydis]
MADILEESRNPAIEAYRAAHIANSSNLTPNSNSNPSKKGKSKKKGKKKASYNVKGQNYSAKSTEQASFMLGSYNLAIEEEEEFDSSSNSNHISNSKERPAGIGSITLEVLSRKAPPTYTKLVLDNVLYLPNININIVSRVRHYDSGGCLIKETLYRGNRRYIAVLDFKKSGFFLDVKEPQRNKIVVEIPSNSIRKEDYRPIIDDAIVSKAIEPNKRYKLRNSPAKGTTLEGGGPSLRGKRPYRPPTNNTALEGELVDLDLDLEGAVSLDPLNLNTEKPISIEIGPSKLESYESSSDKPIFAPKPIEVIAPNQPITNEPLNNSNLISEGDKMQLDYYKLLAKTSSYILSFVYKARKRVISKDSTPTTYKQVLKLPRDERSKWLEAITKEFIQLLELGVFKFLPRSLLPSNCKLITCRNVLKVKKDAKNRPIKYKSREEIYMEIPKGLLDLAASNKAIYELLLKYGYNPSTPNIIKLSKALYSLKQSLREWQDKLKILLKSLGYLPLILDPGVFYNAKTCHFIVTYIDDCLFIGPNIGYITDLKKQLNKVYAIEDLGPAAYFLGMQIIRDRPNRRLWLNQVDISFTVQWLSRSLNRPTKSHLNAAKNLFKYLNSTKDYSICFSCNGNAVADLGPKLSNSSNITTKLSRDFHSKEGPRPLTTTSTTIVDSRNSKGSSRTSIINSSLVPIGFSDSDFAGDKATSKSTYGYLFKLAGRPISWKTKRATTIALSTPEAETDGLTEAICKVQWIIGLFSELYRPIDYPITLYRDNQGSITVANNPALHARTKYTLLKFQYVREQVKAKIVTIIYLHTKFFY